MCSYLPPLIAELGREPALLPALFAEQGREPALLPALFAEQGREVESCPTMASTPRPPAPTQSSVLIGKDDDEEDAPFRQAEQLHFRSSDGSMPLFCPQHDSVWW